MEELLLLCWRRWSLAGVGRGPRRRRDGWPAVGVAGSLGEEEEEERNEKRKEKKGKEM